MNKDFEKRYLTQGPSHWWTRSRRDILLRMARAYPQSTRILDIGCGGGELLRDLRHAGVQHVTGIDISEESISFCRNQNISEVYRMDAAKLNFPDASFDLVIASDILEHMKDDEAVLREWRRVLADKGVLILFVPAFMFLWSKHDEVNHHYRRYTKKVLLGKFSAAGFSIGHIGYWNFLLFLPIALVRLFQTALGVLFGKKDAGDRISGLGTGFLNGLLSRIVRCENAFIGVGCSLPIGSSIYVVARKTH